MTPHHAVQVLPSATVSADKAPGHWVLARLGKRVLRPGGLELTRRLLSELAIGPMDRVVEFAPGLGITAKATLARQPLSYTAVERDPDAAAIVQSYLSGARQQCVVGSAEATGLPGGSASVVYGEAMLSMQVDAAKARIIAEAARLLIPGGRYGIHELCFAADVDAATRSAIRRDLSEEIHVGVRPLGLDEWQDRLWAAGLSTAAAVTAPMHLLEPARVLQDEGPLGALRFAWNLARDPVARRRVLGMRHVFRKYANYLTAVAIVAVKSDGDWT